MSGSYGIRNALVDILAAPPKPRNSIRPRRLGTSRRGLLAAADSTNTVSIVSGAATARFGFGVALVHVQQDVLK